MIRFSTTLGLSFLATLAGLAATAWLVSILIAPGPPPKRFISDIFEFDLAPGWACDLDETEYVCRRGRPPTASIAIIAMKRRSSDDNLEAYEAHLRNPQANEQGKIPELLGLSRRHLANHEWVEGVQLSSEIPNYVTIYLASHTSQVGILATFTFHRDREAAERKDIDFMMSSLRIHQLPPQ
ncbi:MAG: hypothetical protein ACRC1G_12960 [Bradyrhizobium sp.]|nr:hypothetical protein [Bradyrhizobium sp.]